MEYKLSSAEAAECLGISIASLKNWVRQGLITPDLKNNFISTDVERLLEKIETGTISRLDKRANKKKAQGRIAPACEYKSICSIISAIDLPDFIVMYLTLLKMFIDRGQVNDHSLERLLEFRAEDYKSPTVLSYLKSNRPSSNKEALIDGFKIISKIELPCKEPAEKDIAGIIFQAIKTKGSRAETGSFYTPEAAAADMILSTVKSAKVSAEGLQLADPCCGTGQFLLAFIKAGGRAENIYGVDADPAAAFTAGANILLQSPELQKAPRIFCADSLLAGTENLPGLSNDRFDLVVTNPPWGAFSAAYRKKLKLRFTEITSGESFSFFILRCIELLKPEGVLALVLPESFLNVKRHADIRKFLCSSCRINKIENRGKIFSGVFSSAITLEAVKLSSAECPNHECCRAEEKGFLINEDFSFSMNINKKDLDIIDKLYSTEHFTLKENAEWALGIVTGNNAHFLKDAPGSGLEPVIKGSDILPGIIRNPSKYIDFKPDRFQQTAPEWKYRAEKKLVYRFINKRLIFALDTGRRLTLNSANILIPDYRKMQAWGLVPEDLALLFNSDIYSFIYRKKFNSVKILRSHLEQLPIMNPKKAFELFTGSQIDYIKSEIEKS